MCGEALHFVILKPFCNPFFDVNILRIWKDPRIVQMVKFIFLTGKLVRKYER